MADHDCEFPQVEILDGDEDEQGNLRVGMQVLTPCPECGDTPLDHLQFLDGHIEEMSAALLAQEPNRPLFHWAPAARRKQIIRHGLRPRMRPTTSTSDGDWRAGYVCFADSPSWAWALSGAMPNAPAGEWDLWQTWQARLTEPIVLATPDRPSGIYEVRVPHRIYKRNLWFTGSRVKEGVED